MICVIHPRWLPLLLLTAGCAGPASSRPIEGPGRCDPCGRATDAQRGGGVWSDGRVSCLDCRREAVVDRGEALAVLRRARAELKREFGLAIPARHTRLVLTDKPSLLASAGKLAHPNLRAYTEVTELIRNGKVVAREFEINVLWGFPRQGLLGIFCHELFHIWQAIQGGTRQTAKADQAFREGSANYVQHKVLRRLGAKRWARILEKNPDRVYGGGLRRFRKLVKAWGEKEALRLGAKSTRFPQGF